MSNTIKNILEEYVKGLLKIIGKDLKKVILYGSYARNEQNKDGEISDIDIMILVDSKEEKIKELEKKVIDYSYDLDLQYDILLSPIIENIKSPQIQKQMVIFNSQDHWKKFLFSKLWIGSFSLRYELFPQSFGLKDIHYYNIPAKWYFIPHGMAVGDKNPIMCHKYSWDEPLKTFCCNKYEQKQFSEKYGFEKVAHFHKCGYKFNLWHDILWLEKIISNHNTPPKPFINFNDL